MTSEYQEDGKTLKENCERGKKASSGDRLSWHGKARAGCQNVLCSAPPRTQPVSLSVTLWLLSLGENSFVWLKNYIPGGSTLYTCWASLLISRLRGRLHNTGDWQMPQSSSMLGRGIIRNDDAPPDVWLAELRAPRTQEGSPNSFVYPW